MNSVFKNLLIAFVAIMGFVGCETSSGGAKPAVTVESVGSTDNLIIFSVKADGADKCAYMLYDGDVISADKVLSEGVQTKGDGSSIVVNNLEKGTTYYVVAAAINKAGVSLSNTVAISTTGKSENTGTGEEPEDPNNPGGEEPEDPNNPGGGNDDGGTTLPEIDGVENLNIVSTKDGRWYEVYNFYVTFVVDNGDKLILDFYTLDETMSCYLPYGSYNVANSYDPYVVHNETSRYVPLGVEPNDGYYFTDGYVNVDVANGYYSIYFMLTYDANGTSHTVQGYYNDMLSGASVPKGDDAGAKSLIEVLDVGSSYFKFNINAEEGQYWRCSIVDKRVYDQTTSNPGAWVVTYGFMLEGPLTINWVDGQAFEYIPGYQMSVSPSTTYLVLAALMDYSEGQENSLLSGVEIVEITTSAEAAGTGEIEFTIKEIGVNEVTLSCLFGSDVWCCYVAMLETEMVENARQNYTIVGYNSFEECMLSLIPGLSHDFMRQFIAPEENYVWDALNYNTNYTPCIKVVDQNGGASLIIGEEFTTLRP